MKNLTKAVVRPFLFFVIAFSVNSCFKEQSGNSDFSLNEKVIIIDTGKIYPSISHQDCLTWNSLTVKEEAKDYKWRNRNYTPKNGDEGIIIHLTPHCDTKKLVAILKVDENYVPIAISGIKKVY
ncbi:MAG: hypothetical protein H9536_13365 [Aphanizomenon flos-aquae Clear-A1]|uniref:Lipoprotein n=1 Tax=Aphanizomenon flos-aquae FACHB-1040 TaxID=2692887 RepID=A0ABR8BSU9_APHFL|nr:hypothetical protein [Aphanizomenon flos-aquae]MBD1218282.1 hypothetical protein [Aphanizomenon flos-aquae Clear-A1]MBD2277737.1 hypothetical protein [Aphanizomenon flos-aquae FACHB-1040]